MNNTYAALKGSATIGVEKTVNGGPITTGESFTFTLLDKDGKQLGKEITATKDAPKVNFDAIELTEAGEFTYTVHETSELGDGWTNDSDFTVTLTVADENGTFKVTDVKYGDEKRGYDENGTYIAKFDNKYEPDTPGEDTPENPNNPNNPGEAKIGVYKTVNGGTEAKPGEKFTFQLFDKDGKLVDTVETEMGEVKYFDNKKFELVEVGTHTFTIHETGHNDNGWTAASDVTATVVVSKTNGKTTAEVTYSNTKEGVAGFDNTYAAKAGSATIGVEKTVNGGPITTGESFTFTLLDKDGKQVGKEITATKDNAKVNFDAIELTEEGTFTYTVHETSKLGDGWTNDDDFTVTITVEDVDGTLKVTSVKYGDEKRGYDENGTYIAKFDNKYEPDTPGEDTPENPNNPNNPGEAKIGVYKTVNGGTEAKPGEKFTFQLFDKDGKLVDTVETEMGEVKYFDNKKFELVEVGTHTFTIHETGHNDNGWTAASDVTATVVVSKTNGKTTAEVTYSNTKEGVAGFDNTYAAKAGSATIGVEKTVNGGPITTGESFTFTLLDKDGKQVGKEITATKDNAKVNFDAIELTEEGTFTYTVHETSKLGDGWTNDDDFTVTITVEDVDGTLKVTSVKYGDEKRGYDENGTYIAKFDNKYDKPGTETPGGSNGNNNGGSKTTTSSSAKTGDSLAGVMAGIAGVAAAAGAVAVRARRKQKNSR